MALIWFFLAMVCLLLLIAIICFCITFFVPSHKPIGSDEYPTPPGKVYEPFRDRIVMWMKETRKLPSEDFYIQSFDGLKLHGRYYEYAPGAPIELMFHGYRGNAERDLCGGVHRCFALKRSALVVDQRASGASEGHVITFGIKEHQDCLSWVNFMVEHFGPDVKIILTGISMGASTVLMAAGKPLPPQVKGVLADCGFTSAKAIMQTVCHQLHLPAKLLYPFIRFSAIVFGGFDIESYSPLEAVKHITLPVIFFHGEDDDFVPHQMSIENHEACSARKALVIIPKAGHGLSYPVDKPGYLNALNDFFGPDLGSLT